MVLEICVDSVDSAIAAASGGAQRVELCSALIEGGLTPSRGLIRAVRSRVSIGLHVMVRPRGGDFFYSDSELEVMRDDIAQAAQCGADGVVLGLLTPDGNVDVERTRELIDLARPMEVTYHRAIDLTRDVERSLEDVIASGADRLLTSGGKQTAMLGRRRIRRLVEAAQGRIRLMVGGGVRVENVSEIAKVTGALEFHAALRTVLPDAVQYRPRGVHLGGPGIDDYVRSGVRVEDVRNLRQAIDALCSRSGC